jgi:hypothetical protein
VLGIVALILVLVVAIVYMQARQRSRVVSTALSARMGLSEGALRRSVVLELSAVLFAALAVGGTVGMIGAAYVTPYLDPLHHLQLTMLRRYRAGDTDELVERAIHLTINGLATGLRNSG